MNDPGRQHAPRHAEALADARLRARQALSALRAVDASDVSGEVYRGIERTASQLRDVADELQRIEQRVARGQL